MMMFCPRFLICLALASTEATEVSTANFNCSEWRIGIPGASEERSVPCDSCRTLHECLTHCKEQSNQLQRSGVCEGDTKGSFCAFQVGGNYGVGGNGEDLQTRATSACFSSSLERGLCKLSNNEHLNGRYVYTRMVGGFQAFESEAGYKLYGLDGGLIGGRKSFSDPPHYWVLSQRWDASFDDAEEVFWVEPGKRTFSLGDDEGSPQFELCCALAKKEGCAKHNMIDYAGWAALKDEPSSVASCGQDEVESCPPPEEEGIEKVILFIIIGILILIIIALITVVAICCFRRKGRAPAVAVNQVEERAPANQTIVVGTVVGIVQQPAEKNEA